MNEEIDESCQKCGAQRAESPGISADEPQAEEQPSADEVSARESGKPKADTTANAVSILLIIACVLAIGAVGYFAWQRGLIGRIIGGGGEPAAVTSSSVEVEDVWADAPPVSGGFERKTRPAREAVDAVLRASAGTVVTFDDSGALAPEADEALRGLAGLGADLVWRYQEFEAAVAEANDPLLGEYAQFVRDRFALAMQRSLEVVAQAYARDPVGGHPAYLLSDAYRQAADKYGLMDGAGFLELWDAAVHAKRQRELDHEYVEEYRALEARLDTLREIHSEFNAQLTAMPPYTVRSGVLGKDARDLLELLGELADKIQLMVVEFEEYRETISSLEPSDRMQEYAAQFESLAKTDHLYAFEEIYKLYEQDRELEHPVYSQVAAYYQFVLEHWSEAAMRYEEVYQGSEAAWALRWGNR